MEATRGHNGPLSHFLIVIVQVFRHKLLLKKWVMFCKLLMCQSCELHLQAEEVQLLLMLVWEEGYQSKKQSPFKEIPLCTYQFISRHVFETQLFLSSQSL
jgi:hypothetical protein